MADNSKSMLERMQSPSDAQSAANRPLRSLTVPFSFSSVSVQQDTRLSSSMAMREVQLAWEIRHRGTEVREASCRGAGTGGGGGVHEAERITIVRCLPLLSSRPLLYSRCTHEPAPDAMLVYIQATCRLAEYCGSTCQQWNGSSETGTVKKTTEQLEFLTRL